ncbi:MAG: hypothetical protein SGBAC_000038 [Bacillariaceae sp.]
MLKSTAALLSLISAVAGFAPAATGPTSTSLNAEKSPAVPFLPYPANLKGYTGDDIGFDPLGISEYFPMDYLREAELKHGRIAQLAIVGYICVDQGVVLHPLGQGLSSAAAHDVMVQNGVMGNMLVFIGLFEMVSWIAVSEMLQGSGRAPGDFGWGMQFLEGKSEKDAEWLKYQEIVNGRLAMMAFSGAVTQSVLYDVGFPYLN